MLLSIATYLVTKPYGSSYMPFPMGQIVLIAPPWCHLTGSFFPFISCKLADPKKIRGFFLGGGGVARIHPRWCGCPCVILAAINDYCLNSL